MAGVEEVPPPVVSKAGSYTIFITPPAKLKPQRSPASPPTGNVESAACRPQRETATSPPQPPPPVQVPPPQFAASPPKFAFFWNAVAKVQDAHSSLDRFLADWFGLNQSKYQWALDDFYDNNATLRDSKKLTGEAF